MIFWSLYDSSPSFNVSLFENHKGIVHINEILDHLGVNLDSVCVSVGATLSVHGCCHQSV